MLHAAITAARPAVENSAEPPPVSADAVAAKLCAVFASAASATKKLHKKVLQYWVKDELAKALLQAVAFHVSSGHAQMDALTIQAYLVQHTALLSSHSVAQPQLTHGQPRDGDGEPPVASVKAIDAATLTAALDKFQEGPGVTSLARLDI